MRTIHVVKFGCIFFLLWNFVQIWLRWSSFSSQKCSNVIEMVKKKNKFITSVDKNLILVIWIAKISHLYVFGNNPKDLRWSDFQQTMQFTIVSTGIFFPLLWMFNYITVFGSGVTHLYPEELRGCASLQKLTRMYVLCASRERRKKIEPEKPRWSHSQDTFEKIDWPKTTITRWDTLVPETTVEQKVGFKIKSNLPNSTKICKIHPCQAVLSYFFCGKLHSVACSE